MARFDSLNDIPMSDDVRRLSGLTPGAAPAKAATPRTASRAALAPAQAAEGASAQGSAIESALWAALDTHGADIPPPAREYLFFAPWRQWRFDAAWAAAKVAVECDGGQWAAGGGRHNTDGDRDKLNAAAAIGWRVLRFSGTQLRDDPAACVALIRRALAL